MPSVASSGGWEGSTGCEEGVVGEKVGGGEAVAWRGEEKNAIVCIQQQP